MTDISTRALDRELKRGSAELLILSLLDARPRHGYELSKLIHTRSGGQLTFHIDSLYPLLYRLILKWRDVRVVEGARLEIESPRAC
jgi:PadR family transcriptional regulator PadR